MTLRSTKKQRIYAVLSLLLCVTVISAIAINILITKKNEVKQVEQKILTETTLLQKQTTLIAESDQNKKTLRQLEQQVPVRPMFESFLMELAEIEKISKSTVTKMTVVEASGPKDSPEHLKIMTTTMDVSSPQYTSLQTFIKSIEGLQRLTKIDMLSFNDSGSTGFQQNTPLTSKIAVSFYYLSAQGVPNLIPTLESHAANKANPLVQTAEKQKKMP